MGKISVSDKITFENQKKKKMWKLKTFLHKAPSKRLFWNGIHNLLRRADARGSADIILPIRRRNLFATNNNNIKQEKHNINVSS